MHLRGTCVGFALARPLTAERKSSPPLAKRLPPAVAGLALLIAFGRQGVFGPLLGALGISLPFTTAAVVIAQMFVAAPLYVRSARIGFAGVDFLLAHGRVFHNFEHSFVELSLIPAAPIIVEAGEDDALAGLLSGKDDDFVQEPPLLLSDGTTVAKLTFRALGQSKHAPQFFISGGRCVHLKAAENGVWILEIMPETGALIASVTLLSGREAIEYPLAVVPSLELFDAGSAGPEQTEFVRNANRYILSTVTKNNPK